MDSLGFAHVALVAGVDVATALEERRGQATATRAETFPIDAPDKEYLEALGFKFLGPIEHDPLFQQVEMPEGWKKVVADHPMWTDLVDPKGRVRGRIFVNLVDNKAFFKGLKRRLTVSTDADMAGTQVVGKVFKDGEEIFVTEQFPMIGQNDSVAPAKAKDAAEAWLLAQGYTDDTTDPTKYWD